MAYKQARARHRRLLKTYSETKKHCGAGVAFDEDRQFYYKFYPSNTSGYARSLRKISNKKIRSLKDCEYTFGSPGNYRKVFDYKWSLY